MIEFKKDQRVIVRGIIGLAGMAGTVVSAPSSRGPAWVRLDKKFRGGSIVVLYPFDCDLEETKK